MGQTTNTKPDKHNKIQVHCIEVKNTECKKGDYKQPKGNERTSAKGLKLTADSSKIG